MLFSECKFSIEMYQSLLTHDPTERDKYFSEYPFEFQKVQTNQQTKPV